MWMADSARFDLNLATANASKAQMSYMTPSAKSWRLFYARIRGLYRMTGFPKRAAREFFQQTRLTRRKKCD